jgi:hypothetical protein
MIAQESISWYEEMRGETYPVLPGDITDTSNRYVRNFKCLQVGLGLIVPDLDLSITTHQP